MISIGCLPRHGGNPVSSSTTTNDGYNLYTQTTTNDDYDIYKYSTVLDYSDHYPTTTTMAPVTKETTTRSAWVRARRACSARAMICGMWEAVTVAHITAASVSLSAAHSREQVLALAAALREALHDGASR